MLTREQIDARRGKLTASRIACLMTGDTVAIMDLWRELTDDPTWAPDDLSKCWPVRLGEATEQLNLDWFEMKSGPVTRRGAVVIHPRYPWAAATLDGWCEELSCPIECKHVGGREPLVTVIDRYQPQMQWQMEITGAKECALSVIMGANEPIIEFIPRNLDYAEEMIRRGKQFMRAVELRQPPVALAAVPPPVDASRVYDMTPSNFWAENAHQWIAAKPWAEVAKTAEKNLKAIVPEDAKRCVGHGIYIVRDRAGRLSLRKEDA